MQHTFIVQSVFFPPKSRAFKLLSTKAQYFSLLWLGGRYIISKWSDEAWNSIQIEAKISFDLPRKILDNSNLVTRNQASCVKSGETLM